MKIYYQWEPGSYSHLASLEIQKWLNQDVEEEDDGIGSNRVSKSNVSSLSCGKNLSIQIMNFSDDNTRFISAASSKHGDKKSNPLGSQLKGHCWSLK